VTVLLLADNDEDDDDSCRLEGVDHGIDARKAVCSGLGGLAGEVSLFRVQCWVDGLRASGGCLRGHSTHSACECGQSVKCASYSFVLSFYVFFPLSLSLSYTPESHYAFDLGTSTSDGTPAVRVSHPPLAFGADAVVQGLYLC
jgi:hypothetical protein